MLLPTELSQQIAQQPHCGSCVICVLTSSAETSPGKAAPVLRVERVPYAQGHHPGRSRNKFCLPASFRLSPGRFGTSGRLAGWRELQDLRAAFDLPLPGSAEGKARCRLVLSHFWPLFGPHTLPCRDAIDTRKRNRAGPSIRSRGGERQMIYA